MYVLDYYLPLRMPPAVNPSTCTAVTSKDGRIVNKPAVKKAPPSSLIFFLTISLTCSMSRAVMIAPLVRAGTSFWRDCINISARWFIRPWDTLAARDITKVVQRIFGDEQHLPVLFLNLVSSHRSNQYIQLPFPTRVRPTVNSKAQPFVLLPTIHRSTSLVEIVILTSNIRVRRPMMCHNYVLKVSLLQNSNNLIYITLHKITGDLAL